jgi:hypothetical protein
MLSRAGLSASLSKTDVCKSIWGLQFCHLVRNLASLPIDGYYHHQPINLLGCTPLHRLDYNILEEKIK